MVFGPLYQKSMNSVKTMLYMGSLHGFFTFYLPFELAAWVSSRFDFGIFRYVAVPLWIVGAAMILRCCMDMVRRGGGTPAHMDPPRQLIITGLYRHVRNPIYLGALLALLGHTLWSGSWLVIVYFLCYAIAFHIIVIVLEEPVLRRKFNGEYEAYCDRVPRWIPKVR